jgi:hypothetical protein
MLTRRAALRIGLGVSAGFPSIPTWAFTSKEFWNEKPPADWTSAEVQELLNKSPWAKEAAVSYDGGPGGAGGARPGRIGGGGIGGIGGGIPGLGGGIGGRRGGTGGGYPGGGPAGDPRGGGRPFAAVVRWDSALPIRDAMHVKPSDDTLKYYIVAVIGDMPSMGRRRGSDDDDQAQDERRLEMLKQYTKLERKGNPIFLSRTEATSTDYASGAGTLFYFERGDSIFPDDKQVTFVTKMGPYEVRAKFTLKDMLYHGKLEL